MEDRFASCQFNFTPMEIGFVLLPLTGYDTPFSGELIAIKGTFRKLAPILLITYALAAVQTHFIHG